MYLHAGTVQVSISMLFHFYMNISVTMNDNGTLFHIYLDFFTKVVRRIKVDTFLAFNMPSLYIAINFWLFNLLQ